MTKRRSSLRKLRESIRHYVSEQLDSYSGNSARKVVSFTTYYDYYEGEPDHEQAIREEFSIDQDDIELTMESEGVSEVEAVGLIAGDHIINNSENLEPSSSDWHRGVWYRSIASPSSSGEGEETTFHLHNFSKEEERAIYDYIIGRY